MILRKFMLGHPLRMAVAALVLSFGTALANTPSALFTPDAQTIGRLRVEQGAEVASGATASGAPAIVLSVPGGADYPGFDFPKPPSGVWNLSAYAGVAVDVTNNGPARLGVNMRVGNPGDWRQSPWNTEIVWIAPGSTRTVKVTFGRSFGNPGYALDASRVDNIKVFVARPKQDASLVVSNLRGFGAGSAPRTAQAPAAAPVPAATAARPVPATVQPAQAVAVKPVAPASAAASNGATRASPSISGELLTPGTLDIDKIRPSESTVTLADYEGQRGLYVVFEKGANYPNIRFPIPEGGWNLSAFGGVEVTVRNLGTQRLAVALRVDGPGRWQDEPWNTQIVGIGPDEARTIRLTFGQTNNAPGYPLDPSNVVGMQVFAIKPKQDSPVLVYDLKTWGSPQAVAEAKGLTSPEDRNKPVTPPEWLGKRPPVAGDWVLTLNENFDGDSLDADLWTPRFPWDGPQPGQLQRYAPENVTVENGVAKFKAEKRFGHENNDPGLGTREYTSGIIQSYDKWTQAYGYFEARVKLPTARGLWPAFWMMPDRGKQSGMDMWGRRDTGTRGGKGMEIDILEHLTEWGPGRNNVAMHWDGYGASHKSWGSSHIYYGPTPDGWHAFGLLWEPGKLTWYIDGKKVQEWENERVAQVPVYLKLNIQMGGWATKNVDDSALPDYYEVDYVRAWQLKSRLPQAQ